MEKQFLIRCVGYTATLNTTYLKLYVGQRYQLTVNMTNYGGFSPTWSSSNPSIAAVNSLGLVGANNVGTATITCDPIVGPKISCRVEVVMPDGGGSGGDDSGGGSGGDDTGGGDTGGDDTGGGEDNFEELYNSAVRRLGELRSESMEYIDNNRI
ncbi:MAG: Ig-like domain-containing protein [Alistipes sp.]|nr:Ig-like domain-containing protein [Alistipes sp.]